MNNLLLTMLVVVGIIIMVFIIGRLYSFFIEVHMYRVARDWNDRRKINRHNKNIAKQNKRLK